VIRESWRCFRGFLFLRCFFTWRRTLSNGGEYLTTLARLNSPEADTSNQVTLFEVGRAAVTISGGHHIFSIVESFFSTVFADLGVFIV